MADNEVSSTSMPLFELIEIDEKWTLTDLKDMIEGCYKDIRMILDGIQKDSARSRDKDKLSKDVQTLDSALTFLQKRVSISDFLFKGVSYFSYF